MTIQHRPTFAEINLDAFRHNMREISKHLTPGVQVLGIVKANAYGHGALMCARILKACGVPLLAVATLEEGMELRNGGIQGDILVLDGLMADNLDDFLEFRLKPVLHSVAEIERLGPYLKVKKSAP